MQKKINIFIFSLISVLIFSVSMVSAEEITAEEARSEANVNSFVSSFFTEDEMEILSEKFGVIPNYSLRSSGLYLTYKKYFKKVKWITRKGKVSLSIIPKASLYDIDGPASGNIKMARTFHSFKLLKDKFKKDKRWKNEKGLFEQYSCHVLYAGKNKIPWNIEPWRKAVGPAETALHLCNP